MTYFTESEKYGRKEVEFDSKRFLADLVAALGGSNPDPEYQGGRFDLGDLSIYLRQGYGAKARRVTISCGASDRAAHQRAYSHGRLPAFPSITVDPDRPLDVLVKDIKRRVIDAAVEPLAALKAADAAQGEAFASLQAAAARINARFPGAVTLSTVDTVREAPLYLNGGGSAYLSGRLQSDGRLYVDRVGTVDAEKVERLLALLTA